MIRGLIERPRWCNSVEWFTWLLKWARGKASSPRTHLALTRLFLQVPRRRILGPGVEIPAGGGDT